MKKKFLWLGLVLVMVAAMVPALVATSCSNNSTTTATTTQATTPAANTPTTGGSLTVFTQWGMEDPSGFDSLTQRIWSGSVWINPFTEWLCRGDVEKYGPSGDN